MSNPQPNMPADIPAAVCPECRAGKCVNCTGMTMLDDGSMTPCRCTRFARSEHP